MLLFFPNGGLVRTSLQRFPGSDSRESPTSMEPISAKRLELETAKQILQEAIHSQAKGCGIYNS
jgi:hypothetical protein